MMIPPMTAITIEATMAIGIMPAMLNVVTAVSEMPVTAACHSVERLRLAPVAIAEKLPVMIAPMMRTTITATIETTAAMIPAFPEWFLNVSSNFIFIRVTSYDAIICTTW